MIRIVLFLLCWMSASLYANKPLHLNITGITGDTLLNVQHRLTELNQHKSIHQESLDIIRMQVAKALYPYGYFKPEISVSLGRLNDKLMIHIIPGKKLLITSVQIDIIGEGAQNTELQRTLHDLPLKVGSPMTSKLYEESKDDLANTAERQGYLHATFETAQVLIDEAHYTARIIWLFQTGPQYYFGSISFNSTSISSSLLNRYVPFKYGQPYSTEKIMLLNSNLASSGYFNSVNVTPVLHSERNVPIDVDLQPVKRVNYSVGAGYGTDTGPRGRLGLSIIPVNEAGHKFNAVAQGSFTENTVQGQYIIPGGDPVVDQYNLSGGFTNLSYNAGHSNAALVGVATQHMLTNYQRTLSLNALHERYNYTGLSTMEELLFFPKGVFTWSQTTDPLFSPSGYNITLTGFGASKALLSQVSLAQISINAKAAVTLSSIRTRFYFHAFQGYTLIHDINQLPLSQALLLGGSENLKGYNFNSIGPGKVMTYMGGQIQKETFQNVFLIGFIEGGDVYDPFVRSTKYDAGVGIMWLSPVGPIKIELAQAVNQQGQRIPDQGPKIVINMGPDL